MKKPLSFNNWLLKGFSLIVFLLLFAAPCYSATYTFQWDANHPNDNVDHYLFYWGETSGVYDNLMDGDGNPDSIPHNPALLTYSYQKTFTDPVPALFFSVTAVDEDGLESDLSLELDTVAPQITSAPTVVSVTDTTATISWTTDKPGTSVLEYGITTAYGSTAPVPVNILRTTW